MSILLRALSTIEAIDATLDTHNRSFDLRFDAQKMLT
jgi:hypothetical protein